MQLNAEMNSTMTERFNVAGALLVKLFGRPTRRTAELLATRPAGCATSASRIAMYGRVFFAA
jgi:ATP-binding cassette, subfamily B, bacterial